MTYMITKFSLLELVEQKVNLLKALTFFCGFHCREVLARRLEDCFIDTELQNCKKHEKHAQHSSNSQDFQNNP